MLVDLRIAEPAWSRALPGVDAIAARAADAVLRAVDFSPDRCEISLLLSSDDEIASLNERFRGRSGATNVLSWPSLTLEKPLFGEDDLTRLFAMQEQSTDGRVFIGDVALAFGVVQREAETGFKSLEAHVSHLIVHGVLHLLGYDHEREDEAEAMATREIAALSVIGVADPYRETG